MIQKLILLTFCLLCGANEKSLPQTNLLIIMFDDLRTELSIYGRDHVINPNIERLASRSVIFDQAYSQISVCNPSRDSMLTGLRPDSVGTYAFEWTLKQDRFLVFPKQLGMSGYNTYGIGKIAHWEKDDQFVWDKQFSDGWFEYQYAEKNWMNSTTMPDKIKPEEDFRDYIYTTKAIEQLHELNSKDKYFVLGIGYKLPHLAMHIPYKYYEMYKDPKRQSKWALTDNERTFPYSAAGPSYRCCADYGFYYMNDEGASMFQYAHAFKQDINFTMPEDMHNELMFGYCAGTTFVDTQIGRLLETIDQLDLWKNTTIILTADHGFHNGEKGLWEKWTLFDEATRVPLLIYHPLSPYPGRHYLEPVELIDIYPTLNDILGAPYLPQEYSKYFKVMELQGKSLAPVVLGHRYREITGALLPQGAVKGEQLGREADKSVRHRGRHRLNRKSKSNDRIRNTKNSKRNSGRQLLSSSSELRLRLLNQAARNPFSSIETSNTTVTVSFLRRRNEWSRLLLNEIEIIQKSEDLPMLERRFAISQSWRCANKTDLESIKYDAGLQVGLWKDCSRLDNYNSNGAQELSLMGYSLRTTEFRYTAWLYHNRTSMTTNWDAFPFSEELYDHRGESYADFTHQELVNLGPNRRYKKTMRYHRRLLLKFLRNNIVFRGPYPVEDPST